MICTRSKSAAFRAAIESLDRAAVIRRLWAGDHTVWSPDRREIVDRLGWLRLPQTMASQIHDVTSFAADAGASDFAHVVLLGMGGSSLAPDALARTAPASSTAPSFHVLDTLHPAAVTAVADQIDVRRTLFLVSTKSGTTSETLSLARFFYERTKAAVGPAAACEHFVAITDPGSPLLEESEALRFARVFRNDPNVGGRYAALSLVGLVPAALLGFDLESLLTSGQRMAARCSADVPTTDNPGAVLGALLAANAAEGRDKLTLEATGPLAGLADWVEQLVAESTGKSGRGILPVVGERPAAPRTYGSDRQFALLDPPGTEALDRREEELAGSGLPTVVTGEHDEASLGGLFFLWEFATAIAGHLMGVHPFDQPDVESSKLETRRLLGDLRATGRRPRGERTPLEWESLRRRVDQAAAGDYVAFLAFLAPSAEIRSRLAALQTYVRDLTGCATTIGFGPRYLHSTGQLHKGDSGRGVFVQLVDDPDRALDLPGPSGRESFADLLACQALGDAATLSARDRRVVTFDAGHDPVAALDEVLSACTREGRIRRQP